ncbi:ribosomal protein L28e [Exidia glandulosa HHB12029]|uniref:Ribosomal protein L28e n=1 Tax=Exidia glandulosa HHB12029 TaxID=1314781 RepID=A0A165E6Z7_EXIGL|nr:ribosomal protein L28e [Exidia glandulosa HHB12029]KZV89585.1 ribosomal protein L28e [Exidia glandulosa HHB12029]
MSSDLQWLLVRKHNSFMVKRLPEGPILSKEPGNLTNIHSHKFSGLTNAETIDIREKDSSVVITTRKPSAKIHTVKKSQHSSTIRPRSGSRRVSGIVSRYASKDYRPDLRKFALARASAVLASTKEPKPEHEKKTRGKKALKA